jgi:hypothetical protein
MSQVPPLPAGLVPVSGNPGSSNILPVRFVFLMLLHFLSLFLSGSLLTVCYIAASITGTFTNSKA